MPIHLILSYVEFDPNLLTFYDTPLLTMQHGLPFIPNSYKRYELIYTVMQSDRNSLKINTFQEAIMSELMILS